MSFNLIAEMPRQVDWTKLRESVAPLVSLVEVFPIVGETGNKADALGLSIPAKNANEAAWGELRSIIELLSGNFEATVIEMYSGQPITKSNLSALRKQLLG